MQHRFPLSVGKTGKEKKTPHLFQHHLCGRFKLLPDDDPPTHFPHHLPLILILPDGERQQGLKHPVFIPKTTSHPLSLHVYVSGSMVLLVPTTLLSHVLWQAALLSTTKWVLLRHPVSGEGLGDACCKREIKKENVTGMLHTIWWPTLRWVLTMRARPPRRGRVGSPRQRCETARRPSRTTHDFMLLNPAFER